MNGRSARRGSERAPSGRGPTARGLAIQALIEIEEGARANLVVPALLDRSHLEARDRHLVTELVYGATRMRRACDWLVDRHTRGQVEPAVRAALRLGAYQLVWTRVPPHAAVAATVAEVIGPGRSLVNAVLRRVAADAERAPVRWPDPGVELSYPDWVIKRMALDLGVEPALAALAAMNEAASASTRPDGYVQDPGSQMIDAHLRPLLGDGRAADLCAAPGGKATGLADPGWVAAGDLSVSRTRLMRRNLLRLGSDRVAAYTGDALAPPLRERSLDLVLVDAPCSGLGVLRRRPDARWRIRPEDPSRLAHLQQRLLEAAIALVRPGGVLAYSVCTLTAVETVRVGEWLTGYATGWTPLEPPGRPWRPVGPGALILPQDAGTDGMYLVALRAPGS